MTLSKSPHSFQIDYDARLMEEAVLLRMTGHPREAAFRWARNRIYLAAETEEREKRFQELHARWFTILKLGDPISAGLAEQPALAKKIDRCCVIQALSSHEEGADLHQAPGSHSGERGTKRTIIVKLRPACFLDAAVLQRFLQHEFTHIADMLDPSFGYKPELPGSEAGPAYDNLLRERYRVLWDTWIDGRLLRRGWASDGVRDRRLAEFATTFRLRGDEAERQFTHFFDSDSQTHAALVGFALSPAAGSDRLPAGTSKSGPCPLCRFPTIDLIDGADNLSKELLEEIVVDFPPWKAEHGLCRQCTYLYQTRSMSRAAEAALPRI